MTFSTHDLVMRHLIPNTEQCFLLLLDVGTMPELAYLDTEVGFS